MLDLVYRVKIFFWRLRYVDFHGVHVVLRFGKDVSFLQVFVDFDFELDSVAGNAADGVFLKFVAFEQYVDDFLVSAVVGGSQNPVANH